VLADTQLTANEVLRAFQHAEPKLFLGAAITTVGILSAAFCMVRRRADALLLSLAVFAFLYGLRLWLESDILRLTAPSGELFHRLRAAINTLIPVPGFIFFQIAGLLPRRGRFFTFTFVAIFLALTVGILAFGRLSILHTANDIVVEIALFLVVLHTLRNRSRDRDYVVLRRGLICFIGFALWDSTGGRYFLLPDLEVYGFTIFLGCMGYVAARRTLERDQQLGEIQKELEVARSIQLSILPAEFPSVVPFWVAAKYVPMTAVAGDFYDFVSIDANHAGLLIADVSGHGVPAALIASMVKMAATSQLANAARPAQLLTGMNTALCGNTQGQFVTAAYLHLDAEARELRYSAAGHPSMLMMRGGGVEEIWENGLLLAAAENAAYTEKCLQLERGDRFLLYTDGLVEARNAAGAMFGETALCEAMRTTSALTPNQAAEQIIAKVQQWSSVQDDDLTVLLCDFVGAA
jgi:sigma-B regulation protein RsbU (phosphoserine phosphatase)